MSADDFDLTNPPWAAPPYNGDSDKWGDEQDRSEWFEAAASYWATRALAAETRGPMAVSGSAIGWLATAQRVAELLNAGNTQVAALNAVGVSPDDAFSEDPALPFDDPDNAIVDLGWHDGACHYVQRGGDGRWTVQTRVSQAAALAAETTAEPEEEATHAVTLTLSLDPETEMGDNAPKTFHEAARLMLTVVDGPLPPGAIHPIRKAGRPDVTS